MKILGIDNGLDGGLVIIDDEHEDKILMKEIMPTIIVKKSKREYDAPMIKSLINYRNVDHAFIEKAQAMPGQGTVSMFMTGYGYGMIRGIISAMGIPYTLVHPKTWQKEMFRDLPKTDTKSMSVIVCKRLWPKADWRASERCRKSHTGLCDAAMISEYGRRIMP